MSFEVVYIFSNTSDKEVNPLNQASHHHSTHLIETLSFSIPDSHMVYTLQIEVSPLCGIIHHEDLFDEHLGMLTLFELREEDGLLYESILSLREGYLQDFTQLPKEVLQHVALQFQEERHLLN